MSYRLCGANHRVCRCNDLEAQPCVSGLIDDYLEALWWKMRTNGAEGGPGDEMSIGFASQQLDVTTRSFATIAECEQWSIHCGCGGFM